MKGNAWDRVTSLLTYHQYYCDSPDYVKARMFYSRSVCSAQGEGNIWLKRLLNSPLFSCEAVVCLSCGQIVVESNFISAIKSFWVRLNYGTAWLVSFVTGKDQQVSIEYYYSYWSKDLVDHLDFEEGEDKPEMVTVHMRDEKQKSS